MIDAGKISDSPMHAAGGASYQTLINLALREYIAERAEPLEDKIRRMVGKRWPSTGRGEEPRERARQAVVVKVQRPEPSTYRCRETPRGWNRCP